MWTVQATQELLDDLLAHEPFDAMDRAIVAFTVAKIIETDVIGEMALPSRVAIRINQISALQWQSKDAVNAAGFAMRPPSRKVPPLDLRRRFTAAERAAITLAAAEQMDAKNPALQVWLDDLNSAKEVDLDSPFLQDTLLSLVGLGHLTAERMALVLDA